MNAFLFYKIYTQQKYRARHAYWPPPALLVLASLSAFGGPLLISFCLTDMYRSIWLVCMNRVILYMLFYMLIFQT